MLLRVTRCAEDTPIEAPAGRPCVPDSALSRRASGRAVPAAERMRRWACNRHSGLNPSSPGSRGRTPGAPPPLDTACTRRARCALCVMIIAKIE